MQAGQGEVRLRRPLQQWHAQGQRNPDLDRQRSSALDSLMDSVELGVHDNDVVLPVHMYLPPIKVLLASQMLICGTV